MLYGYDAGRTGDRPAIRITEFFGDPSRYDIDIHLGPGLRVGRFRLDDHEAGDVFAVDILQGHINWELLQSEMQGLEDFVLLRGGGGVGGRHSGRRVEDEEVGSSAYVYPELALEGAWLAGERGLTQLRMLGRARWPMSLESQRVRTRLSTEVSVERVLVAVNDQPVTLFVRGSAHHYEEPAATDGKDRAIDVLVGGRTSFFVPARPDYDGR